MSARQPAYNVGHYIVQVALYRGARRARWEEALREIEKRRRGESVEEYMNWDEFVAELDAQRAQDARA